jgi:hypothetical protein
VSGPQTGGQNKNPRQPDPGQGVVITREQQQDLDPVLGPALLRGGVEAADLVAAAYRLGRLHERGEWLAVSGSRSGS